MKTRQLTQEEKTFYAALTRGDATEAEYIRMWEGLIRTGINPVETKNVFGSTPAHIAVYSRRPKLLAAVIKDGVDLNAQDGKGLTALHRAIDGGSDISIVKMLLDGGASVSSQDHNRETPLDYAMRKYPANSPILGILMAADAKQRTDAILEPFSGSPPVVDDNFLKLPENISYPGLRGAEDLFLPQPGLGADIPRIEQTDKQSLFGSIGRGLIGLGLLGLTATGVTKFIRNKIAAQNKKIKINPATSTQTSLENAESQDKQNPTGEKSGQITPIPRRTTSIVTPDNTRQPGAPSSITPLPRYVAPRNTSTGQVTPEFDDIGGMEMSDESPFTPVVEKSKGKRKIDEAISTPDQSTRKSSRRGSEPAPSSSTTGRRTKRGREDENDNDNSAKPKIPKHVRNEVLQLLSNNAGIDATVVGDKPLRKRKGGIAVKRVEVQKAKKARGR